MADRLFKSCIKISICTAVLFFIYHLFISQKLDEEFDSTYSKDNG